SRRCRSQMASRNSGVPPAFVYFVKLAAIAATAACLMLSGVGKSGSPAPKSTTSTPSRRRRSASAETFKVEETLMVEIRSAISAMACINISLLLRVFQFCLQPPQNRCGHEVCHVAAERDDLFDHSRADERELFASHQEDGLGLRAHATIQ